MTEARRAIPLDAVTSERGNVRVVDDVAHVGVPPLDGERLYLSHFVTCPNADKWRRPRVRA